MERINGDFDALVLSAEERAEALPQEGDNNDSGIERRDVEEGGVGSAVERPFIPLLTDGGSHRATRETAAMLQRVGGREAIVGITKAFYAKFFKDKHLDQFVSDHKHPHAQRLGNWIFEKLGGGDVWTQERLERRKKPSTVVLANGEKFAVHDRTSAHVAAWNSNKREGKNVGRRFKLNDTRVWMRLMFWSARETGMFQDEQFASYYVRFIAHFIRVYESTAPVFARESARWSENPKNIEEYYARGNRMEDDINLPYNKAIRQLPASDITATFDENWPYGYGEGW